ncbi:MULTISPECIES: hypothetical protein [unclassified Bradyrhizobium]|uniref:hypothetical protein n=1 Tax=unclassified Bradyrhizobium TaxID=2631580 RepID=UPI002FF149BD
MSERERMLGSDGVVAVFVLEIDGRPTLAFEARDFAEALQICGDADLRTDLMGLRSNGHSICSAESGISTRLAMQTEIEVFKHAIEAAPQCDEPTMTFLIGIDGVMVVAVGPERA